MCMVDQDDGLYVHLSSGSPVARKPHRCDDCGRTIRPGERYHWSRWAVEGTVQQEKQCRHCRAAASWLRDRCGGWLWSAVGEDLFEHYEAGCSEPELLRLIVRWRKDWTRRDGTLMPEPRTIPAPRRVYVDGNYPDRAAVDLAIAALYCPWWGARAIVHIHPADSWRPAMPDVVDVQGPAERVTA